MKKELKYLGMKAWQLSMRSKARPLMLMGHPRSGSSLLMHLLCDHTDILGFGEYLTEYDSSQKLALAEFDIRRKAAGLYREVSFIANQVNHRRITPRMDVLMQADTQFIFLIREPEASLSSMFRLSESRKKPMSHAAIGQVYIDRLKSMQAMVKEINPNFWMATTYEELTENTEPTLQKITDFLSLDNLLTPTYGVQKFTQKWGDPSKHILQGSIVKTHSAPVEFPSDILAQCNQVLSQTRMALNLS